MAETWTYTLKITMYFSFSFADLNQRFSLRDEDHIPSFTMKKKSPFSQYSQGRTMKEINKSVQEKAGNVLIQDAALPERL